MAVSQVCRSRSVRSFPLHFARNDASSSCKEPRGGERQREEGGLARADNPLVVVHVVPVPSGEVGAQKSHVLQVRKSTCLLIELGKGKRNLSVVSVVIALYARTTDAQRIIIKKDTGKNRC